MVKAIRQKDIAKKTNFSVNTISLALKGSDKISAETTAIVLAAAKELNYIPNNLARSLVQRKTQNIGIVINDLSSAVNINTIKEIEKRLKEEGYMSTLVSSYNDPAAEINAIQTHISNQVDGLLVFSVANPDLAKLKVLSERKIPMLFLNYFEDEGKHNHIYIDREQATYISTKYLLEENHRHIALLVVRNQNMNGIIQRYSEALQSAGLSFNQQYVFPMARFGYKQGYKAMEEVGKIPDITGIITPSDYSAIGAMRWCRENGKKIPEDYSILGGGNTDASEYAEIPITTMAYNIPEQAQQAVSRLLQMIDTPEISAVNQVIAPRLIVRNSSGRRLEHYDE